WKALDWSPGDREILVQETISINERYLWVFDANGGPKSLVTPKGSTEKTFYGHGHFSKDGKGIYVLTDRESEFRRLAFLDFASQQYRFLSSHIDWDVQEFEPSPDGSMLAIVANENGLTLLHLLDAATGQDKTPDHIPPGVTGIHWHRNGRELGF